MTAEERSTRARAGAFAQHAKYDVKKTTQPARDAYWLRFVDQVDPERELPQAERDRRAQAALKSLVSFTGHAQRVWDTDNGQAVPIARVGDPVRIRSLRRAFIASGTYFRAGS